MLSLKPAHVKRYKDIAWLLYKYGRSDLVQQSGLASSIGPIAPEAVPSHASIKQSASPEELADDLEALGPAFIKLGQLLSTRPDILPQPYLDALARLQDDAKPAEWRDIEKLLEEEFQTHPDRIFAELDRQPVASASLGQVYKATLRDGRRVVVKAQRPNIAESLREDLVALAELAQFLHDHTDFGRRFQVKPLIETLSRAITSELDYRREGRDSHLLADNLAEFDKLYVPRAIDDLTRSRVLTMEYVEGAKITDISQVVLIELDRQELVKQLFQGYLRQVLVEGVFHSDPHPGNLWLTQDGRIALLDFGMMTRVSNETRTYLVKLLFAISHGDGEEAARIAEQMSQTTPQFDRQEFRRQISRVVAESVHVPVRHMGTGRVIMHIQRAAGETGVIVPEALMMLGKTLMNLDRVVAILQPDFDPTEAIREQATAIMSGYSQRRVSLTHIYQSVLDATDLMQELPGRVNNITKRLANNELEIRVHAFDESKLLRGLHKVANRITVGLIIGALIVGASLMMRLDVTPKLLGYPALALVFFMIAAAAALSVLWRVAFADDKEWRV